MELALKAVRPVTPGRLIVVFGSDGDRDQGKRPMLGQVCARLADVLVVTDENPAARTPSSSATPSWTGCAACAPT